jgi:tRNA A37 threonylcarbamoyltransferase TsaD
MRPLQISAETAQKLAKALDVPIEQVMHLPQHILVQKLVEIERSEAKEKASN